VGLEGLGQLEKSNDLIGNRTRDLPDYSIVPQPTTLPSASQFIIFTKYYYSGKIIEDETRVYTAGVGEITSAYKF
jgi:hypothetical protein